MNTLYPELKPYNTVRLMVDEQHRIYVEECGNPDGTPVVFLHGGPGSGGNENHRRYFNPKKYRIIIFDQRGCNRSTPQGSTENNTTRDLLQDLEKIRKYLVIDRWLIFGGSWGSTLGLLYAEQFPQRVTGLILRGTFLARRGDLNWFAKEGSKRIFPDYWEKFIEIVPENERHDPVAAYHRRVFGEDIKTRKKYARAWSALADKVVTYTLENTKTEKEDIKKLLHKVSIETHYAKNHYFIKENQILKNIRKIPKLPVTIIHGRRDLTCTLESSWSLHKALPHSELIIVPNAGHLAGEPAMIDALVRATDKMAGHLK